MDIEEKIFKRYKPNFEKLLAYGFYQKEKYFHYETNFQNNQFKAIIDIYKNGSISGTVFDLENGCEFLPLRIKNQPGAFIGEIRAAYEEILTKICDSCFDKDYFIYPQSNRITNAIIKKYGDKPEFLWKTTPGSGVFRNKDTNKWYLAILDVDRSRIQPERSGIIEIADLKIAPEKIEELIKQEHFYQGYHMNKKYWLTIILDNTVSDEKILELIEESHSFTIKKK